MILNNVYEEYTNKYKCNYYLIESTKRFVDNGDIITTFGIKIEKLKENGQVDRSIILDNIGINKEDVKMCIGILKEKSLDNISFAS